MRECFFSSLRDFTSFPLTSPSSTAYLYAVAVPPQCGPNQLSQPRSDVCQHSVGSQYSALIPDWRRPLSAILGGGAMLRPCAYKLFVDSHVFLARNCRGNLPVFAPCIGSEFRTTIRKRTPFAGDNCRPLSCCDELIPNVTIGAMQCPRRSRV